MSPAQRGFSALCLLCWFLVAGVQAAEQVRLAPVADNSIYSDSVAKSDGAGPHLWVGQHAGGVNQRALLRFDLTSLPPGTVVTSARLSLFMSRTISPGQDLALHRLLASWGEGTSNAGSGGGGTAATPGDTTWGFRFFGAQPPSPWTVPGADYVQSSSATTLVDTAGARYAWTSSQLAADVQRWIDSPGANFGWIIIGNERERSAMRFDSRSVGAASNEPSLELEIIRAPVATAAASDGDVPLPGVWLLVCGLGLVAAAVRARRPRA